MPPSTKHLATLSVLLDAALELSPQDRLCWLDALDPVYADVLPALRRALERADSDLPLPFEDLPRLRGFRDETKSSGGMHRVGDRVGPYQLISELGRGGMAAVWLARRADGAYKRELALKMPIISPVRPVSMPRFIRECDILADLEHSCIARMYDAGVSAEGLPYLAMEFVRGTQIVDWSNRERLTVKERLQLFLQVLDAMDYAHGKQVIHRDIKPSNILVTDSGHVKLLDFGVAKLLAEETEEDPPRPDITLAFGRAFTPDYASPEQLFGKPVGLAADIYSLGVLLHELLLGRRPTRAKQIDRFDAQTTPSQPPSDNVNSSAAQACKASEAALSSLLRGGLDAIIMKALTDDPYDRYATADAFAKDVERCVPMTSQEQGYMKVLVVDDHAIIRDGLALLLPKLDSKLVALGAANCAEAFSILEREGGIGLVLMDLGLPGMSGTEGISTIRARYPELPIVALSGSEDRQTVLSSIQCGAMGFIPKSYTGARLFFALQYVLVHKGIFLPAEILLDAGSPSTSAAWKPDAGRPTSPDPTGTPRSLGLTRRQAAVLQLFLQGKPNDAIAREMNIEVKTLRAHITAVLRALQVTNRTDAVLAAHKLRLVFDADLA